MIYTQDFIKIALQSKTPRSAVIASAVFLNKWSIEEAERTIKEVEDNLNGPAELPTKVSTEPEMITDLKAGEETPKPEESAVVEALEPPVEVSVEPDSKNAVISGPPTAIQIAEKYIGLGYYVYFTSQGMKKCTVDEWQEKATRDVAVARSIAGDGYMNVMLVGKQNSPWVLDFDDVSILDEYEKIYGLTNTRRHRSVSGGIHLGFLPSEAAWVLRNTKEKDERLRELWSMRMDDQYVLAPGSTAHPENDVTKPLAYYEALNQLPLIEAPLTLLEFLKARLSRSREENSKKSAEPRTEKIAHGGLHPYLVAEAGRLRRMNVPIDVLETTLIALAHENCEEPIDESKVSQIARSMGKYEAGVPGAGEIQFIQPQPVNDEPEIEESLITKRPEFPRWVMAGTSLDDGLVRPATEHSQKYPELIFIPAMQLHLNALALHVHLKDKPRAVPNMFVGVITPYGQYFKSTCCELGHAYFSYMGSAAKYSRDIKNADGKTIITSVGSTEGLGKSMSQMNAKKCLLYFDELSKVVNKIGIDNSSFGPDLLSMYESGDFGNTIKDTKSNYSFEAKTYCFGWQWCCVDRTFPRLWSKLDNIRSGLNDRMFFLLAPEKPKEAGMYVEGNFVEGAIKTKRLIDRAIQQDIFDYEDHWYAESKFRGLDARGLAAAEWFALYFAVDLGLSVIDSECVDRARALADYRRDTLAYLDPVEAETFQGRIQQEIIRELRRNGGKQTYRNLHHNLSGRAMGSGVWDNAFNGLRGNGTIDVRAAVTGKDVSQRPKMVYLLKQMD